MDTRNPQKLTKKELKELAILKANIEKFSEANHTEDLNIVQQQAEAWQQKAIQNKLHVVYQAMPIAACMKASAQRKAWESMSDCADRALDLLNEKLGDQEALAKCEVVFKCFNDVYLIVIQYFLDHVLEKSPLLPFVNLVMRGESNQDARVFELAGFHTSDKTPFKIHWQIFSSVFNTIKAIHTKTKQQFGSIQNVQACLPKSNLFYGLIHVVYFGLGYEIHRATGQVLDIKKEINEIVSNTLSDLKAFKNHVSDFMWQPQGMKLIMLAQHFIFKYSDDKYIDGLTSILYNYTAHCLNKLKWDRNTLLLIAKYSVHLMCRVTDEGFEYRAFNSLIHKKLKELIASDDPSLNDVDVHLLYVWKSVLELSQDYRIELAQSSKASMQRYNKNKVEDLTCSEFIEVLDRLPGLSEDRVQSFQHDVQKSLSVLKLPHNAQHDAHFYFPLPELNNRFFNLLSKIKSGSGFGPKQIKVTAHSLTIKLLNHATMMALLKKAFGNLPGEDCVFKFLFIKFDPETKYISDSKNNPIMEISGRFGPIIKDMSSLEYAMDMYETIHCGLDPIDNVRMKRLHDYFSSLNVYFNTCFEIMDGFKRYPSCIYNGEVEITLFQKTMEIFISKTLGEIDSEIKMSDELEIKKIQNAEMKRNAADAAVKKLQEGFSKKIGEMKEKVHELKNKKRMADRTARATEEADYSSEEEVEEDKTEREVLPILSQLMTNLLEDNDEQAQSCYQNLTRYDAYRLVGFEGILVFEMKILIKQLNRCINMLNMMTKNIYSIDPVEAKECYRKIDGHSTAYEELLVQYDDVEKQIKSPEGIKNKHNLGFGLPALKEHKDALTEVWKYCEEAKTTWQTKRILRRNKKIMKYGLEKLGITDKEECKKLKNIARQHHISGTRGREIGCTRAEFNTAQNAYDEGYKEFVKRGRENQRKYGSSIAATHRQYMDEHKNTFAPPEQHFLFLEDKKQSAVASKPASTFFAQPPHSNSSASTAVPETTSAPVAVINASTSSSTPVLPERLHEFLCEQFISGNLEKNYCTLKQNGILDLLIPNGQKFRQKNETEIRRALKIIGEKIAKTPLLSLKNDLIFAHVFTVILFYSIPSKSMQEGSGWDMYVRIPLENLSKKARFSDECNSALYSLLTGKLALLRKDIKHHGHCVDALRETVLKQIKRLMDETNLQEIPYHAVWFGSKAVFEGHFNNLPLIKIESAPKVMDILTNIPQEKLPFPCQSQRMKMKNLFHPVVDGKADSSVSIIVKQESLLQKESDVTLGSFMVDFVGGTYVNRLETPDYPKALSMLLPFNDLESLIFNSHTEVDKSKLRENPALLQYYMLIRLTKGNAAQYIMQAVKNNALDFLFDIPEEAKPLSDQAIQNMMAALTTLDANRHPNPYEQLSEIIFSVLYHSTVSLQNREEVFKKACIQSIHTLCKADDTESDLRIRLTFGSTRYIFKMKKMQDTHTLFAHIVPNNNSGVNDAAQQQPPTY